MTPSVGFLVKPRRPESRVIAMDANDGGLVGTIVALENHYGDRPIVKVKWNKAIRYPCEDAYTMRHYVDTLVVYADPDSFEGRVYSYIAKELSL